MLFYCQVLRLLKHFRKFEIKILIGSRVVLNFVFGFYFKTYCTWPIEQGGLGLDVSKY